MSEPPKVASLQFLVFEANDLIKSLNLKRKNNNYLSQL